MRNVPLRHVLCPYSSVAAPTYGGGRPLPCASAARHHSHPENRWLGGSSYPSTWLSEMCQLRSRRGPVGEFLVSGILPPLSPNDIGRNFPPRPGRGISRLWHLAAVIA